MCLETKAVPRRMSLSWGVVREGSGQTSMVIVSYSKTKLSE